MAAISAARTASERNKRIGIIVFEAEKAPGKKLLVTGNGRCNLTNTIITSEKYFGDRVLFNKICSGFDNLDAVKFFESIGVLTVSDGEGRVYPRSFRADSVVNALIYECLRLGIEIVTETGITSVVKTDKGYLLNGKYIVKSVIIAAGGLASPSKGAYGTVAEMLKTMGVEFTKLSPSLTSVSVKGFPGSLKGVRAKGRARLVYCKKLIAEEQGEIQYTDYGLSGIAIMQLSAYIARLNDLSDTVIQIDSVPDMSFNELKDYSEKTKKRSPEMPVELFLSGLIPGKLGRYFIKETGLSREQKIGEINKKQFWDILNCCKAKSFSVSGLKGFDHSQVTSGGIKTGEVISSLELKKLRGIYVCGEMLDIDGLCGGYNLQWAWSSGFAAGKNCVMEKF